MSKTFIPQSLGRNNCELQFAGDEQKRLSGVSQQLRLYSFSDYERTSRLAKPEQLLQDVQADPKATCSGRIPACHLGGKTGLIGYLPLSQLFGR